MTGVWTWNLPSSNFECYHSITSGAMLNECHLQQEQERVVRGGKVPILKLLPLKKKYLSLLKYKFSFRNCYHRKKSVLKLRGLNPRGFHPHLLVCCEDVTSGFWLTSDTPPCDVTSITQGARFSTGTQSLANRSFRYTVKKYLGFLIMQYSWKQQILCKMRRITVDMRHIHCISLINSVLSP